MSKPTHKVTVKRKDGSGPYRRIGAAWEDLRGWIEIKLDPCVVLTDRDNMYINLYPVDSEGGESA